MNLKKNEIKRSTYMFTFENSLLGSPFSDKILERIDTEFTLFPSSYQSEGKRRKGRKESILP